MSDPYGWLDNGQQGQATEVQDPYAWLDAKPKMQAKPKAAPKSELRAKAEAQVAKEREGGGIGRAVKDTAWNLLRGTPVGSFADEAAAGLTSALSGQSYDEALAYQRAANRAIDKDSTVLTTLPGIGDVTVGGATKLAGGILSGGALARAGLGMINVMRGSTAIPTLVNLGVTGGAAGALYGAGEGEGGQDRLGKAALGAGVGTVAGPVGYLAGRGMANAISGTASAVRGMAGRAPALRPYDPGAVRRVQRAVVDDDLPGRAYNVESARLGREGMLLDMGDNLQGQASAIANAPGQGQSVIRGALRARDRTSRDRLTQSVNQALGAPGARVRFGPGNTVTNYPTYEEAVQGVVETTRRQATPLYDQFRQTQIPMTQGLRGIVERAQALDGRILERARDLMRADGVPQAVQGNNTALLDYARRHLNSIADTAARAGDANRARIAGNLARDLNAELDSVLQRQGSTVYADARGMAGQGLQFREGAEEGLSVLSDNNLTAQRLRDRLARVPGPQAEGLRVGAREDLRRRMETGRSAFGNEAASRRGATQGRQIISSDEARAKVNALGLDPVASRNLIRRADAEGVFADSSNRIMGNSATAARLSAQREFPSSLPTVDVGNEIGKKTLAGAGAETAYRTLNFLMAGTLDERRMRIAADAARMLVAQGQDRDAIVRAIMAQAQRQGISAQRAEQLGQLAALVTRSTDPAVMTAAQ